MMYRNAAQPDPVEVHKVVWFAMLYTSTLGDKEGWRPFLKNAQPTHRYACYGYAGFLSLEEVIRL